MELTRQSAMSEKSNKVGWRNLYLASGILLILTPILSFVVAYMGRILYTPSYPSDPASYLQLISQRQGLATASWIIWIIADFLLLLPSVALYILLHRYNRTLALLGSLISIFYIIYDVSVTELNSLTLVSLGHAYAAATNETLQSSFAAAATYGYYALPLQTVLSYAIGSIGWILWCVPMTKSFFGRWTAIFGVIVNITGILGAAYPLIPTSFFLGLCQFMCVRLIAVWFFIMGVQLLRHLHRLPKDDVDPAGES
ncbi:MAG TPA: DUF4386 family protein [Anaerolineales bacterium]|nr:DUF4386 family protein [Anaerolineales bacterium]